MPKALVFEDTNLGGTPYRFSAYDCSITGGAIITCHKDGYGTRDYRLYPERVRELRDWLTKRLEENQNSNKGT